LWPYFTVYRRTLATKNLAKISRAIAVSFRFEFDNLENADHDDPLFDTEENMKRMFFFLDKHLKIESPTE